MGPWQLVRLLSESELARVYSARPADAPASQPANYVVKALRKEWWRDPQAIEMQRRAVWVGRQVSHPHLLPVLSANVQQAPFYFVTPKLAGCSLAVLLKQGTRLPIPMSLWIVRQVAEALAALHEATQMIHSDVKPNNIIVSAEGHATLIDLGFAYSASEARHWSSRPVTGTLNYIAPEAVTSSLAVDAIERSLQSGSHALRNARRPSSVCGQVTRRIGPHAPRSKTNLCSRDVASLPKPVASLVHRLLRKILCDAPVPRRPLPKNSCGLKSSASRFSETVENSRDQT